MMCTDCIWVQEGMDEVSKTPPNSPSHSEKKLRTPKPFVDTKCGFETTPKPFVDTKCGFETTPKPFAPCKRLH